MPRLERRVDKHGFPIPGQIDDLPGRTVERDAEQFGNVSFRSGKRELSESGQRWKKRIIWLGIIGVVVGLLFSSLAQPLWDVYADIRSEMGFQNYLQGDLHGARGHFDAALSADPTNIGARLYRGKTLYELQELDAAREDLSLSIETRNPYVMLHALDTRAMIHYRQQRPKDAMDDADQAVKIDRKNLGARNSRAYLCALLDLDLKKGLADIDLVLQRDPNNAAYLDTRGYLLFKQGDHEAALADLDRAIQFMERQNRSYQMEQRRTEPGQRMALTREQFENIAKQTREGLGVMYYHRGEVYEALKRPAEAANEKSRGVEYGYNPAEGVF